MTTNTDHLMNEAVALALNTHDGDKDMAVDVLGTYDTTELKMLCARLALMVGWAVEAESPGEFFKLLANLTAER